MLGAVVVPGARYHRREVAVMGATTVVYDDAAQLVHALVSDSAF
jgi:hypothetical protein